MCFINFLTRLVLAAFVLSFSSVVSATNLPKIDYARFDDVVTPVLAQMTLAEKVGQMTQAHLGGMRSVEEIHELALGSVLRGGNADPSGGNSRESWAADYSACQRIALKTRLAVPLLYGIDAVHGHNNIQGAVIFPHNIGLGCANDPDLVEQIGRITAREVRATGIHWAFAPCIAVPRDDRWGRTYEGFSEDPSRVGPLGAALVRGLQGTNLRDSMAVLACAKHWVGDGGTTAEMRKTPKHKDGKLMLDQGDTRCDEQVLRRIHVAPYLPSLAEGVGSVMVSYSSWNGTKCSTNRYLITDVLKEELGFQGLVISDFNAIDQCHKDYKTAIGLAINAGIDMAMVHKRHRRFIRFLIELVEEGTVPTVRIDDAVRRILRVKAAMGLLDSDSIQANLPIAEDGLGSEEHRQVARRAVQKSVVVLKNSGLLPLSRDVKRIHVCGAAADNLGVQCGGWTIDWQGRDGEITPGGTTILEGIRQVAGNGIEVTFTADGANAKGADAVVIVVGEQPYAEGAGDTSELTLSNPQCSLIEEVKHAGVPVCLVILSGRPLELHDEAIACDVIVAAWLPGTEGVGVADILFGNAPVSGTLSFTWPRRTDQHPLNVGDTEYHPLFPYGHGLSATK